MKFLRIAGHEVPVLADSFEAVSEFQVGEDMRMADGSLRTTRRRTMLAWTLRTLEMSEAEVSALKAVAPHGSRRVVSGLALGGTLGNRAVLCEVSYGQDTYEADGAGYLRSLSITLRQVWRMGVLALDGGVLYAADAGAVDLDPASLPGSENGSLEAIPDDHNQAPEAQHPEPRFTAYPRTGHRETPFGFDGSGSIAGQYPRYLWDWGDGTIDEGVQVTHRYWRDGVYTVRLTVIDEYGQATVSGTVQVDSTVAPQPSFAVSPGGLNPVGTRLEFISTSQGMDLFEEWDFGDGASAAGQPEVTHEYAEPGEYTVRLTITDAFGAIASSTQVVRVGLEVGSLVASFDVEPGSGPVETEFEFDASASRGDIASFIWDFGDGSDPELGAQVSKIFAEEGSYTVTLTVIDPYGNTAEAQKTITVAAHSGPDAPSLDVEYITEDGAELVGSVFSDPNPESEHWSSAWQVVPSSEFDPESNEATESVVELVRFTVVGLLSGVSYTARVRYQDDTGIWSEWSVPVEFVPSFDFLPPPNGPGVPGEETSPGDPWSGGEGDPPPAGEGTDPAAPARPVITVTNLGEGNTVVGTRVELAGSEGIFSGDDEHHSSRWQLSKDIGFETTEYDSGWDINYKRARAINNVELGATLYARVAYKGTSGSISEWSTTVDFSTAAFPAQDADEIWRILPDLFPCAWDIRYRAFISGVGELVSVRDARAELPVAAKISHYQYGSGPRFLIEEAVDGDGRIRPFEYGVFQGGQVMVTVGTQWLHDHLAGGEFAVIHIGRQHGGSHEGALIDVQTWDKDTGVWASCLRLDYDGAQNDLLATAPGDPETVVAKVDQPLMEERRRLIHAFRSIGEIGTFVHTDATSSYTTEEGTLLGGGKIDRIFLGTSGSAYPRFDWRATLICGRVPDETELALIKDWAVAKHLISLETESLPERPTIQISDIRWDTVKATSSEYSDDLDEGHAATEWQVCDREDFAFGVITSGWDEENLTEFEMTDLEPETQYYARVRYKSAADEVSAWSELVSFTTIAFVPAPVASFGYDGPLEPNYLIEFASTSTGDELTYTWDMGDGTVYADALGVQTHLYAAEGSYSVTLTVEDKYGRTDEATQVLEIVEPATITRTGTGLLFYDDFNRPNGSVGSKWQENQPMSIDTGKLAAGSGWAVAPAALPGSVIAAKLGFGPGDATSSIRLHTDSIEGYNILLWYEPPTGRTYLRVNWRAASGVQTTLADASVSAGRGGQHDVKVELLSGSQKVWLNGVLVVTTFDGRMAGKRLFATASSGQTLDDAYHCASNLVTCTNLPAGHKLVLAGGPSAVESGGTAVVDCGGLPFPLANLWVTDAQDNVVVYLEPAEGVWGGDIYNFAQ